MTRTAILAAVAAGKMTVTQAEAALILAGTVDIALSPLLRVSVRGRRGRGWAAWPS